eukprot:12124470-Alexandrium_andersonii.AAC.1
MIKRTNKTEAQGKKEKNQLHAWRCEACGTFHMNPLCMNCRQCGRPQHQAPEMPKPRTVKITPWERRREAAKQREMVGAPESTAKTQSVEHEGVPRKCRAAEVPPVIA